ncbi:hypothetical protein [Ruminococcus sp.]|jgi:hypothetical protein|uniref:hypothetical protein n=1 Tax=Ruminococcus sp. TaxID=41978 RepID=UPI0025E767EE|nr:hypothetical protein [Ruminococcus sp.]
MNNFVVLNANELDTANGGTTGKLISSGRYILPICPRVKMIPNLQSCSFILG